MKRLLESAAERAIRYLESLDDRSVGPLPEAIDRLTALEETTNRVIDSVQADGTCWCGGTVWQDQQAMRISVSSWATTGADVERSLSAMLRAAAEQD